MTFSGVDTSFPSLLDSSLLSANGKNNSLNNTANTSGSTDGNGEKEGSREKFACGRCGRSYQHQATLVRHQRYECGKKASYACSICNRLFKRRDVLKGHMDKCMNKAQAAAAMATAGSLATSMASSMPTLGVGPGGGPGGVSDIPGGGDDISEPVSPPSMPSMIGAPSPFLQNPEEAGGDKLP